jgi:hypothetical protein
LRSELNIIDSCNLAWCLAHTLFDLDRRKELQKILCDTFKIYFIFSHMWLLPCDGCLKSSHLWKTLVSIIFLPHIA